MLHSRRKQRKPFNLFSEGAIEDKESKVSSNNNLPIERQAKLAEVLNSLLQHVAKGQQQKAEAILECYPELLLEAGTVKDYSDRMIESVTPFELAYGADDLEMCQMMLPYFYILKDGRTQALQQIQTFAKSNEAKPYDFSSLVAAFSTNQNVEAALEKFRDDFKPGLIKKGQKHFNIQILLEAFRLFEDNKLNFKSWRLFYIQVIGYLQRMLPACYAQAFSQGLFNVTQLGLPLERTFTLYSVVGGNHNAIFFPLDLNPRLRLGFDCTVHSGASSGQKGFCGELVNYSVCVPRDTLQAYVDVKFQGLLDLISTLQSQNRMRDPMRC